MTSHRAVVRKVDKLAFTAYMGALLMTIWAALLVVTTFATNDYTWILIQAISFAAGAVMLLVWAWTRMPVQGREIAALLILVDGYVMANAAGRLLHW